MLEMFTAPECLRPYLLIFLLAKMFILIHFFFSPLRRYKYKNFICTVFLFFAQMLSHVQLCNPMGYSPPGSSVHGILLARILEWVAIPPLKGVSWSQGSNPHLLCLLHWQVDS